MVILFNQRINKETYNKNYMDLTNLHRTFHPATVQRILSLIDHMLHKKISLVNMKKLKSCQVSFLTKMLISYKSQKEFLIIH